MGDAGLTGRKIIVDTYGGYARHGGGAFSGGDRRRWIVPEHMLPDMWPNIVAAGLADNARFSWLMPLALPARPPIDIDTFGTGRVDEETPSFGAEAF